MTGRCGSDGTLVDDMVPVGKTVLESGCGAVVCLFNVVSEAAGLVFGYGNSVVGGMSRGLMASSCSAAMIVFRLILIQRD